MMSRVVLTGGPGAGKTTLLATLAAIGFTTVEESARAIIAERLAGGASRRPDIATFAREILRRDIEKYLGQSQSTWVFYDRGVIDALGLLQEVAPLPARELDTMLSIYRFHSSVFILPPWEAIYTNDGARDQSFAVAVDVHDKVVQWCRAASSACPARPCRRRRGAVATTGRADARHRRSWGPATRRRAAPALSQRDSTARSAIVSPRSMIAKPSRNSASVIDSGGFVKK
jgi:predicted ATPase